MSVITCENVSEIVHDVTTQINPLPVDIVSGTSGSSVHSPYELKQIHLRQYLLFLNFD